MFVVACGTGQSPVQSTGGASSGGPSSPAVSSPAPSIDAAARLTEALDGLADSYEFESTVTVGSEVATHAIGFWIYGASEVEVDSGAATVTYRSLPPKAWVREGDDGDWAELDGEIPDTDPLGDLRSPIAVSVVGIEGPTLELVATYAAVTLGLLDGDPVQVSMKLGSDGSVIARYEAPLSRGVASAETTMRPLTDASPIPAPSIGG